MNSQHTHGWKLTPNVDVKEFPTAATMTIEIPRRGRIIAGKFWRAPAKKSCKATRAEKPALQGTWDVSYSVKAVAGLTLGQADEFVRACPGKSKKEVEHLDDWFWYEPKPLVVDLTYPLARGVRLLVNPLRRESLPCKACGPRKVTVTWPIMSPGYLLWVVAREYKRIYKEHKKYGVWGHAISDLGFEYITISKDGVVDLGIGS